MIIMDIYKKGTGIVKTFKPVNTFPEVKQTLYKYCKENNLLVVAKERYGDAYCYYLSDGTGFVYTIED